VKTRGSDETTELTNLRAPFDPCTLAAGQNVAKIDFSRSRVTDGLELLSPAAPQAIKTTMETSETPRRIKRLWRKNA